MKSPNRQTFAEYLAEKDQPTEPLTREEFEDRVVEVVTLRLGNRPWFQGVCINNIMGHYPNLSDAILSAEADTIDYDGRD